MARFDQEKLDALVLHIAHRTQHDENFGRTKLAKVLFYSDFGSYRSSGEPLTGATYIRMPFGPFPSQLRGAELRLERAGRVRLAYDVEEQTEKRILPIALDPDLGSMFEPWQITLVDLETDRIAKTTARRISDDSHEHPGWILAVEEGTEIPYETAFLPEEPPLDEYVEQARHVARERGWLSKDGFVWERRDA